MLLNMTSFLAAFFLLVIVLLSITSIYAGLLKTLVIDQDSGNLTKPCDTCFCVLGERLLHATEDALCMKFLPLPNETIIATDLWRTYCWGDFNASDPNNFTNCDQYFANYPLTRVNGFPGLGSKNLNSSVRNFSISNNLWPNYMEENDIIVDPTSNHEDFNDYIIAKELENSTSPEQEDYPSWIKADIDSSFTGKIKIQPRYTTLKNIFSALGNFLSICNWYNGWFKQIRRFERRSSIYSNWNYCCYCNNFNCISVLHCFIRCCR